MSHIDLSKIGHTFIDFEASSLNEENSYPISVGIIHQGKAYYWLIKPKKCWTDWDYNAEKIHSISREYLVEYGKESTIVAEEIRMLFGSEAILCSDNPFWDKLWLTRLEVHNILIVDVFDMVMPGNEGSVETMLECTFQKYNLTRHNALDDAIALALTINQLQ